MKSSHRREIDNLVVVFLLMPRLAFLFVWHVWAVFKGDKR